MFRENKNLKDSPDTEMAVKDTSPVFYNKTDKLITALYMVTDMIAREEPLRGKLRTLGNGIVSDMHTIKLNNTRHAVSLMLLKVDQIMSFLDIASSVGIISEMNCGILKNEFIELNRSVGGTVDNAVLSRQVDLSDFFREESRDTGQNQVLNRDKGHYHSIGHILRPTRIGVQKGSTLLKALSDKVHLKENSSTYDFDILKKQRRNDIINFISKNNGSATITDIKNAALASFVLSSEKTLQRELVSMIKDDVLEKTGEKRWSRYLLKKPLLES